MNDMDISELLSILRDYCENSIEVSFDAVYNALESLGYELSIQESKYKPYGVPIYKGIAIYEYGLEVLSIDLLPVRLDRDDKWYIYCAVCIFDDILSEKWINSEFENEDMNERYKQYKNGILIV